MPTYSPGATGVPSTNKVPAIFLEVALGAGVNLAGGGTRKVILLGYKLAAGTAADDTEVKAPTTLAEAEGYWGAGSELAIGWEHAIAAAPGSTVEGIAVTKPAGNAASQTLTVANAATGSDTYSLWIHDVQVDVAVLSGDSAITIATNIAAAINGAGGKLRKLIVTAANGGTAVVTITHRHVGTRGNLVLLRQKVGVGITGSTFTLGGAALAGGTGDETLTAALATLASSTYKYYAPAQYTTGLLQAVQTQLTTMAGPLQGRRQTAVYATAASLATATTQAQTLNEARMQGVWHKDSETLPFCIAAAVAAVRSVREGDQISVNLDGTDLFPVVKAQPAASSWPSQSAQASALDVGLTPLGVNPTTGHVSIVRSITTHSLDGSSNPDTRVLDTTKVVVPDDLADTLSTAVPSNFPNLNLVDDPVDSTDDVLPPGCTRPSEVKKFCAGIARSYQDLGHITNLDEDLAAWAFNIAANTPGRVNGTMPITVVTGFHQFSGSVRQIG